MKTTNRGKRFKEVRYLSADDNFAANTEIIFYVKNINAKRNKINGDWHKQSKI